MAIFGFPNLKIELDATVGGALTDISAYVTEINGYDLESLVEEITAAGDTTDRWAAIGFTQKSPIELTCPYDDTASKAVAILRANLGGQLTLKLTFDTGTNADTKTVEIIVNKLSRQPASKALTKLVATLQPTGAVT